ncbi:MAG: polyprenyl synthetase family protein [Eubacteriales bacterium]|nr:polyprenyl synthetase family protein [Eubacteriales bacterium]
MEHFKEELNNKVDNINKIIKSYLPEAEGYHKRIADAMNYSVNVGGKRIRPLLMLETYKLCGGKNFEDVYPFMAAIEIIHSYSLVHDDLPAMDNDEYRRGQLTTHKKYGEDFGILAGDGLLNLAYETMIEAITKCEDSVDFSKKSKAAGIIAKKSGIYGMVGGQSLDVYLTDKSMDGKQLDYIFRLKTGALIEASFMAGAVLAGCDEGVLDKLENAGNLVGFAFQIKDDILDITSTQEVLGKPVLSDERNNKTTYVSLYGMDKATEDVDTFSERAIDILKELGDNDFLIELVKSLISRNK